MRAHAAASDDGLTPVGAESRLGPDGGAGMKVLAAMLGAQC